MGNWLTEEEGRANPTRKKLLILDNYASILIERISFLLLSSRINFIKREFE